MKRVLVAQHAWEDPPGTLGEMMQEWGILFDTVKVEEAPLPDLDHYDAFIILGGPQYAGDDEILPYLVREKRSALPGPAWLSTGISLACRHI